MKHQHQSDLITADEVAFAGEEYTEQANRSYYLYNNAWLLGHVSVLL